MRVSDKQYGQFLYELVDDQDDIEDVVAKFVGVLKRNNDMARIEKIVVNFGEIWNERKGIVNARVVSASVIGENVLNDIENFVIRKTGASEVNIVGEIDKKAVLGGIVIEYRDKVIDASLRTRINDLRLDLVR